MAGFAVAPTTTARTPARVSPCERDTAEINLNQKQG